MIREVDERCEKCGDRTLWVCFWGNLFLVVFKVTIGIISGSLAVLADALHSGADVLNSVVTMIAVRIAKKPADRTHPYGHGKTEFVGGVFVGIVLLGGASFIAVSSLGHLLRRSHLPAPHFIALGAAAISIAVNELMFRWTICAARHVNSTALEAEAYDNRGDSLSSVPVFFGVLGAQFGFRSLDPLAALFVGILVCKIGFELLSKNLHGLMDMPLSSQQLERIRELAVAVQGVEGIDCLRTRGLGRHYMADLQIFVNPKATVEKSDAIAAVVRSTLQREIQHLKDITIVCKAGTPGDEEQKP